MCVIVYLFPCVVEISPHIMGEEEGEDAITFKFRVIRLWEQDPEYFVAKHLLPFYILLPAMKNPSVALLKQALREMSEYYSREVLLYRFRWFYRILRRTTTMSEQDKQVIEEELKVQFTYEELIKEDPVIQNLLAQSEIKGKIEDRKQSILDFLSIRFSPALAAQARAAVMATQVYEVLEMLFRQLIIAPDERTARTVVGLPGQDPSPKNGGLPNG
jgi:hypothetical protein